MKHYLCLLLMIYAVSVHAQLPPGAPASKIVSLWGQQQPDTPVKRDVNFVFDKHYYDLEDHWVVLPKKPGYVALKGMYSLGFIYFDAQTGYTIINEGLFDINAQGHAYGDTSKSAGSIRRPLIRWPSRVQLGVYTSLVGAIPDNMLNDLNVKKVPDWLPEYRRNNPDTITSLARKLTYGHIFKIYAKDAAMHIGEYVEAAGVVYGSVVKPDPANPGSTIGLLYLGDNYPDQKFTIVIKDLNEKGQIWAYLLKTAQKAKDKPLTEEGIYSATGKIFLLDGKPAVEIKYNDLGMVTWVDRIPTASELKNFQ